MDYRLKKQSDFSEVFLKGKRVYSRSVTLIFVKKNNFKIGISVSKKHGNAVQRNHIKRLLRAAYIPLIDSLEKAHIVFLPKIGKEVSFEEFSTDILYLLKKEKLINESHSV